MSDYENLKKQIKLENKFDVGKALIALFLAFPASVILRAYTMATIWYWFIVPLGVQAIGMAHAFGIVLVFNVFTWKGELPKTDKDVAKSPFMPFVRSMALSGGALLFGWIYKSLM